MQLLLTAQEVLRLIDPVLGVVLRLFKPDEGALDVRLWGHGTETQSGISSDDALAELVLGMRSDERRCEYEPHRHEESGEDGVENEVEEKDLA